MTVRRFAWGGLLAASAVGCVPNGEPESAAKKPAGPVAVQPAAPATPAAPVPTIPSAVAPPNMPATPPTGTSATDGSVPPLAPPAASPVGQTPPVLPPPPPGTVRVEAKAGEGLKGQSLQGESGILVEPAKAFFNVQQRVVFDVQIPEAMKLYKALEGRAPANMDEFMAKIVAANNLQLPTLPPGSKYVYDPQKEALMVERAPK